MQSSMLLFIICFLIIIRLSISITTLVTKQALDNRSKMLREYLDSFIVAGSIALVLITFIMRPFYIPSASMEPTLPISDILLANEFEYRFHEPKSGDVVVFNPPIPTSDDFIKRLIGVPGDTIAIHNGVLYRNGKTLVEPYIKDKPNYELDIHDYGIYIDGNRVSSETANIPPASAWLSPNRIPPGCYMMFGDNRNNSDDSHIWGFAQRMGNFLAGPRKGEKAGFTGRAFVVIWPIVQVKSL